jgi:hypothetical protein
MTICEKDYIENYRSQKVAGNGQGCWLRTPNLMNVPG